MKSPQDKKERLFWIVFMGFALIVIEIASYISTGHLVFPFCRYACSV